MGSNQSNILDEELISQEKPICATETKYCLSETVQLRMDKDFTITDAQTGALYFELENKSSCCRDKKVLVDSVGGQHVLNQKEYFCSSKVFEGGHSIREICEFKKKLSFSSAKVTAEFQDISSGQRKQIVLKGTSERFNVFLGKPKDGGVPIAKMFRSAAKKSFWSSKDYIIEIAAGVDIAFIVTMCIAVDLAVKQERQTLIAAAAVGAHGHSH